MIYKARKTIEKKGKHGLCLEIMHILILGLYLFNPGLKGCSVKQLKQTQFLLDVKGRFLRWDKTKEIDTNTL